MQPHWVNLLGFFARLGKIRSFPLQIALISIYDFLVRQSFKPPEKFVVKGRRVQVVYNNLAFQSSWVLAGVFVNTFYIEVVTKK